MILLTWKLQTWMAAHRSALLVAFIIFVIWDQSFTGREHVVDNNRAACQITQAKSFRAMEAWYAAYRRASYQGRLRHEGPSGIDVEAARVYMAYVRTAMLTAEPRYSLLWPDPAIAGVHRPYKHPLGIGRYSCDAANPHATPFDFTI